MIRSVLVLGGGSAGLIAALTLKRKLPELQVEVLYSSRLGVIGVGEGTTPYLPSHLHHYLGLDEFEVFRALRPVLKLGVRFTWGRRPSFDYTFSDRQHSWRWRDLPRNNGFYADRTPEAMDLSSALMDAGKALPRRADGLPDLPPPGSNVAWHIENRSFVAWLEEACRKQGVILTDAEVRGATTGEAGIEALLLDDGAERRADLFLDCSGFGSELLGRALGEPFVDFSSSLFCDRAVVGGWDRTTEPALPYTLSDTMPAGWLWRIDHPERIHRGYVFSSAHAEDEAAVAAYRQAVPQAGEPRIVKFRSGHYRRSWVGNTIGIGNAGGFVEPLEATALMVICLQCRWIADGLIDSERRPPPTLAALFNRLNAGLWSRIRDFLAVHYRFNDRLDTPFWRRCREEIPLHGAADIVEFYRENGPSGIAASYLDRDDPFGLHGSYAILAGQQVPHQRPYTVPPAEARIWEGHCLHHRQLARLGMTAGETLHALATPEAWRKLRGK